MTIHNGNNRKSKLPQPLRGITVPLITPLLASDKLDGDGLARLVEHVISGGVSSIFVLGTTGEAQGLSQALRCEMVQQTCALVRGRVPVLVGITDTSLAEAAKLACYAADAGAAAVVAAPPYYYALNQTELIRYMNRLTEEIALPLFLYNMPSHTKTVFEADTVRELVYNPAIIGLKDSSGSMVYLHSLKLVLEDMPEFSLLVGPEELLVETVMLGGHGGVNGGANICPSLYVDLYNKAVLDQVEEARAQHRRVMQIAQAIYQLSYGQSSYIRGLKTAVSMLGLCADGLTEPFEKLGDRERNSIRQSLMRFGLLPPEQAASSSRMAAAVRSAKVKTSPSV